MLMSQITCRSEKRLKRQRKMSRFKERRVRALQQPAP